MHYPVKSDADIFINIFANVGAFDRKIVNVWCGKTRMMWLPVSTEYMNVTDRQTDTA